MTTSEQQAVPVAQEVKDDRLWCLHVTGMDDVHPAPNRATAQLWATQFTVDQQRRHPSPHPYDPVMNFTVAEWPWSAERHTAGLAHSVEQNTWPVDPLGSYTSTSQRSADNFNTAMKYTDGPRETLPCKSGEGAGEVVTDETRASAVAGHAANTRAVNARKPHTSSPMSPPSLSMPLRREKRRACRSMMQGPRCFILRCSQKVRTQSGYGLSLMRCHG